MTKRKITTEDALRMMQNLKQSSGGGVSSLEDFGVNASAAELNHVKGVTSNIQEQLNGKASALDIYPVYINTKGEIRVKPSNPTGERPDFKIYVSGVYLL